MSETRARLDPFNPLGLPLEELPEFDVVVWVADDGDFLTADEVRQRGLAGAPRIIIPMIPSAPMAWFSRMALPPEERPPIPTREFVRYRLRGRGFLSPSSVQEWIQTHHPKGPGYPKPFTPEG